MSKQKRYESKEQIEREIDRLHAKKARLIVKCVELDKLVKDLLHQLAVNPEMKDEEAWELTKSIADNRKTIARLESNVRNIDDKHLPRMKRTMAAFLTVPMKELCGEDCGVVAD
jgi:predicted RNase H-like nuclease (RuvC/YqgF family)